MTTRTLLVFPPKFGLPSASAFSTKAMLLMEMAGLDYTRSAGDSTKAPKKKLPVLIDGDKTIPDTHFIRVHLEETYGVDFDEGLTPSERAVATAMISLAEDRLYFVGMAERWLYPENRAALHDMLDAIPKPIRKPVVGIIIRSVTRDLRGQGTGRHSRDEAAVIGRTAIDAFAAHLADKPFMMGNAPTSADASVYPMISSLTVDGFETRLRGAVEAHPSLMAYIERMQERFPLPVA